MATRTSLEGTSPSRETGCSSSSLSNAIWTLICVLQLVDNLASSHLLDCSELLLNKTWYKKWLKFSSSCGNQLLHGLLFRKCELYNYLTLSHLQRYSKLIVPAQCFSVTSSGSAFQLLQLKVLGSQPPTPFRHLFSFWLRSHTPCELPDCRLVLGCIYKSSRGSCCKFSNLTWVLRELQLLTDLHEGKLILMSTYFTWSLFMSLDGLWIGVPLEERKNLPVSMSTLLDLRICGRILV